jgi:hypothetical protein
MTQREDAIRKLLNETEEPLTVNTVAIRLGFPLESTREYLRSMPDVYISGWKNHVAPNGSLISRRPSALYRAVRVPADCPPPPKKAARRRMKQA